MPRDASAEARRQIEICNACRYCEGYCAVFPAVHDKRLFGERDITQLAHLCHNCRSCYYACQYTEPHEFAINLPRALAVARQESWETFAWPAPLARTLGRSGPAIALATVAAIALMLLALQAFPGEAGGTGFYAHLPHGVMVAIFAPAFVLPLTTFAVSLRRYWRATGGGDFRMEDIRRALADAATLGNLDGGHGDGCNFEDEDRFSQARRWAHQATLWGFLLCFASTCAGTLQHYLFDWPAPYGLFTLPKLFGVPGGLLLCLGTAGLAGLKLRADRQLGDARVWGAEMAFVILLFGVSASGLLLYAVGGTAAVGPALALHLGFVLTLFVLTPYSKMAHGLYRMAALVRDAGRRRRSGA